MANFMLDNINVRPARKEDARTIAELFSIASDGVADYIWTKYSEPGQDILELGAARYAEEDSPFSYKNSMIAELGGEILGMILTFPMIESDEDRFEIDPVLRPYSELEQYDSLYVCAMAMFPEYRGKGIGTKLLEIAERQAREEGFKQLSLIVFEQNEGAKRLYERHGYYEVKRAAVVPHELIHFTGDALLLVKDIS